MFKVVAMGVYTQSMSHLVHGGLQQVRKGEIGIQMPSYVHKSVKKQNESTQIISYLIFTQGRCDQPELTDGKIQKASNLFNSKRIRKFKNWNLNPSLSRKQVMSCFIFRLSLSVSLQVLTTNSY